MSSPLSLVDNGVSEASIIFSSIPPHLPSPHPPGPLPESSCFKVLNSTWGRKISKKKPFQLAIEFLPQAAQFYSATLRLHTQLTRIQVPLKGKGVCPKLHVPKYLIHFPAIIYDTSSYLTEEVILANSSVYLLTFELKRVTANFNDNPLGVPAFSSFPMIGHIPGKGTSTGPQCDCSAMLLCHGECPVCCPQFS